MLAGETSETRWFCPLVSHKLQIPEWQIMAKCITLMLDDYPSKKIHGNHAKLIKESAKSARFYRVTNETLRKCIR